MNVNFFVKANSSEAYRAIVSSLSTFFDKSNSSEADRPSVSSLLTFLSKLTMLKLITHMIYILHKQARVVRFIRYEPRTASRVLFELFKSEEARWAHSYHCFRLQFSIPFFDHDLQLVSRVSDHRSKPHERS
jgi:hypothetical protein